MEKIIIATKISTKERPSDLAANNRVQIFFFPKSYLQQAIPSFERQKWGTTIAVPHFF
ncbi:MULTISPECIES: hypothetical protein [unclassified Cryobacterium]|uniref:hypothetical protein n=1 Tax=unclassified Cryobacterium TaxID=2649013 RepID=UPI00141ACA2E|nr:MULTISPECIES: hypothetical protein [unclassified Cryobacterium]